MQGEATDDRAIAAAGERPGRDLLERDALGDMAGARGISLVRIRVHAIDRFTAKLAQGQRDLAAPTCQVEHTIERKIPARHGCSERRADHALVRVAIAVAKTLIEAFDAILL